MLEPIENQYLQVGHINRVHGIDGEVSIISEVYVPTLFDKIKLVHLQNSRGDLIPARIASVRTEEKQNRLSFFVKFEHVVDRAEAEELKGFPVYVSIKSAGRLVEETEHLEDYTSYKVYDDENHAVGEVENVLENPAHPILQIIRKNGQRLLVPFVDEYILSSDKEKKVIRCQNLDQLEGL